MLRGLKKTLLIGLGGLSFLLGMVGIFIPVLPTMPFLLLAAFCFMHGSKTLYHKLIGHRFFGSYIQNYIVHRSVTNRAKGFALIMLWFTLSLSIFLVVSVLLKVILFVIGLAVSTHVLSLKTLKLEDVNSYPFKTIHDVSYSEEVNPE